MQAYQQLNQRHQSPDSSRQHFTHIPPPPPLTGIQNHPILPPPPPFRQTYAQSYGTHLPPPPSSVAPGLGSNYHVSYSRQANSMSPPPLINAQHAAYNPNAYYNFQQPLGQNGQFLPRNDQPLVSATYIPNGEVFGPGVGIPALDPEPTQYHTVSRNQQDGYSPSHRQQPRPPSSMAGSLRSQRSGGHQRGISQSREESHDLYSTDVPGSGYVDQPREMSRISRGSLVASSTRPEQNSPELITPISPHDAAAQWPMEKVLAWLEENSFSREWQDTFQKHDIQGSRFLDISRGHHGRGDFKITHTVVYPQLQEEYKKKKMPYDPVREQEEGRRLRKIMRRTLEGSSSNLKFPRRRDSVPWFSHPEHAQQEAVDEYALANDLDITSPGASATDSVLSPRPSSGQAQRHQGMPRVAEIGSQPPTDLSTDVALPEPLTVAGHRSGIEITSRNHLSSESAEALRSSNNSPQPSLGIDPAKILLPSSAHPANQGQSRYYGGHRRGRSSESLVGNPLQLPAGLDSKKPSSFLNSIFGRRNPKKDDSYPPPEDIAVKSPQSPLYYGQGAPARPGISLGDIAVERLNPRSPMSELDARNIYPAAWASQGRPEALKKFVLITPDSCNFRLFDVSGINSVEGFRRLVSQHLGLSEFAEAAFHLTHPGQYEHDAALSTESLLNLIDHADHIATIKLLVRTPALTVYSSIPFTVSGNKVQTPSFTSMLSSTPNLEELTEGGEKHRTSLTETMNTTNTMVNGEKSPRDLRPGHGVQNQSSVQVSPVHPGVSPGTEIAQKQQTALDDIERMRKRRGIDPRAVGSPQADAQTSSSSPMRREGVIDFDQRRKTPFEPLRSPPPVPADTTTLIKANSLSRRSGLSKRPSYTDRMESPLKLGTVEDRKNSIRDKTRRKRVSDASNHAPIPGPATSDTGKANSGVIPPLTLSTRSSKASLSGYAIGEQGREFPRAMASVNFNSGRSSPGGSPPGFTMSKGNVPFKIPEYEDDRISDILPGSAYITPIQRPRVASTPREKHLESFVKSPEVSPSSAHHPMSLSRSSTRKGYVTEFTEMPVTFEEPELAESNDSDDDSDDGLFAVPLDGLSPKDNEDTQSDVGTDMDDRNASDDAASRTHATGHTDHVVRFQSPQESGQHSEKPNDRTEHDSRFFDDPDNLDSAATTSRHSSASNEASRARRQSFVSDVWAHRPPAEALVEDLDHFFPNVDLDQPMLEERVDSQPASPSQLQPAKEADPDRRTPDEYGEGRDFVRPLTLQTKRSSASQALAQRSGKRLGRTKSIREVVKDAYQHPHKNPSHPLNRVNELHSSNISRRKSTKMFGAKIEQIRAPRSGRGIPLETIPQDTIPQDSISVVPQRQPTFKWMRGQLIGKGTFGRVYLGMNTTTGELLAVKQVEVNPKQARDKDKIKEMVKALDQEIDTMQHLDHPNIVQYLGCERKEFSISIFLEYISGGSIGSCLRKHGKFQESVVSSLTRQTLDGLAYLHTESILHRDLKADNILLDLDGTCKISDFGISKKSVDIYGNDVTNTMQGSVFWMAPEVVRSNGHGYSAKVDIWSLGCVVLEMFAGRRPWSKEEVVGAIFKLGSLNEAPPIPDEVSSSISPAAVSFMLDCFDTNPQTRPTAKKLLEESSFVQVPDGFNFFDTDLYDKIRPRV